MKIYDSPNLRRAKVIEESDADEIIAIIYRSKHWLELLDGRGYVFMWGWKFAHPIGGTGLAYTSVV